MDIANRCPLCDLPQTRLSGSPCAGECDECAALTCACASFEDLSGVRVVHDGAHRVEIWPVERAQVFYGTDDLHCIEALDRRQVEAVSSSIQVKWTAGIGVFLRHISTGVAA